MYLCDCRLGGRRRLVGLRVRRLGGLGVGLAGAARRTHHQVQGAPLLVTVLRLRPAQVEIAAEQTTVLHTFTGASTIRCVRVAPRPETRALR